MTIFLYHAQGNSEVQEYQGLSMLVSSVGVLSGLVVSQTTTASGSVVIAPGAAAARASLLDGMGLIGDLQATTLDVLTGSPVGGTPRNDIVIIDRATKSIRVLVGTPGALPEDPTVPASAVALARLRHAAGATTIPTAKIDDLRVPAALAGATILVGSTTQRAALSPYVGLSIYRTDVKRQETWDGTGWYTMVFGETTVTTNASGDFSIATGLASILTASMENANGGSAAGARANITIARNAPLSGGNLTGRAYAAETKVAVASTTVSVTWRAWGYA